MTIQEGIQTGLYLLLLLVITPGLGRIIAWLLEEQRGKSWRWCASIEQGIYKLGGIAPQQEMTWQSYAGALLAFNTLGLLSVFGLQIFQAWLPLNPQGFANVPWHLALNTAISFVTNTNWQSYAGEVTLSYFTQMVGLTVQNFVSASTGIAVLFALIRGLTRQQMNTLGNFWVDLVRSTLYVLLPLALLWALVLVSQGVIQTLGAYTTAQTLEGAQQHIPLGPVASQVAIKQLGTNGGGFFNTNSAHPLENPSPLSNFLQMWAILMLPAALTATYGRLVGATRQGWAIFAAMGILFVGGLSFALWAEYQTNPLWQIGAGMEGKETRFGVSNSVLWATATTAASNGSVNAMHSSLSPLAGLVCLFNIMLGEVIFGGVGAGLYGMLIFVFLTVFIAGLMVGRTPEYLGKKIEGKEVKMAMVAILIPNATILLMSGVACLTEAGRASLSNAGPHGLSEILYAFSSAAGNNGSAFAGLNANVEFYNLLLSLAMLLGRFGVILPVLAIAGSLVTKKKVPPSSGTFPTDGMLFVGLLVGIVIIVGALTFLPALALGPFVEYGLMQAGRAF